MSSTFKAAVVALVAAIAVGVGGYFVHRHHVAPAPVPPTPAPTPTPNPPAPPVPPVVATIAGYVIVEDTTAADQTRGQVLASKRVQAFLAATSYTIRRVVDVTATDANGNPPADCGEQLAQAKGKPLPMLFLVDSGHHTVKSVAMPTTPDAFVAAFDLAPHKRSLGNRPPPAGRLKYKWTKFGETPTAKLIPRDKWVETDLSAFLPPVHDQDGRGQCNASATCTAAEAARNWSGLGYTYLSAGDLYSQINGGRDDGSLLEDGLAAMTNSGVATVATVPYVWDGRLHRDQQTLGERKLFRVSEAYLCPTFDHLASAIQQGFFVVQGVEWWDGYYVDNDGWLVLRKAGGNGGHALCGYGLTQRNGQWGILTRNSWGPTWGHGGNAAFPESMFDNSVGGYWAIRVVTQTAKPAVGYHPPTIRKPAALVAPEPPVLKP